jgi:uncharacterized protein YbjQ (UPF0145 family)
MPTSWTVSGQVLQIVATTVISGSPAVGDTVEVHGHHSGSDVVADRIEKVNAPDPGEDVEFEGTVEMIAAASWTISSQVVTITPTTVIEGSPAVGDRVQVHAVRSGASLTATRIRKEDANPPNEGDQVEFREQVNLSVQREVVRNTVLEAAYVGKFGHKLPYTNEINPAIYTKGSTLSTLNNYRMNFGWGSLASMQTSANSSFHGLQVQGSKRFANNFSLQGAYTFSKAIDHAAALGANALIAVRYDATEIMPGVSEVLCYGTAVRVAPQLRARQP